MTNHASKYDKYKIGKIREFIEAECRRLNCVIDQETLNKTHRSNQSICGFSSQLFPEYERSIACDCVGCRRRATDHEGVFLVKSNDRCNYINTYSPQVLKFQSSKYPELNWGKSKGRTFDSVLIIPTSDICKWITDRRSDDLADTTRCKFYIAITRAKYSVGIIYDYKKNEAFEGVKKWNETQGFAS